MEGLTVVGFSLVFGTYIMGCAIVGGFIMLILIVDCVAEAHFEGLIVEGEGCVS